MLYKEDLINSIKTDILTLRAILIRVNHINKSNYFLKDNFNAKILNNFIETQEQAIEHLKDSI